MSESKSQDHEGLLQPEHESPPTLGNVSVGAKMHGGIGHGRGLFVVALLILAVCALFSFWPALSAPIAADDRYWSVETPANSDGSYVEVFEKTWRDIPRVLNTRGRVTPLNHLTRRLVGLAMFDLSHLTATPLVFVQGVVKLVLLVLGVASCLAFVKVLRWRSSDDRLVGAGVGSLTIIGVVLVGLLAAGVQTHYQFRNGWISYPPITYTPVIIIFGSAAAVVAAARAVAERRRWAVLLGVLMSLGLAVLLNWFYELDYLAFPLAMFALLAFPLTTRSRKEDERRGRLVVGGALAGSWSALFLWTRILISNACSVNDCYEGVTLTLGPQVQRTFWYNLVSSVPGSSFRQFTADLDSIDSLHLWTDTTPGRLWIVSVALGLSVWVAWRWASTRWPTAPEDHKAEARLLALAGIGSLALGVGGALIMSLSIRYQEIIDSIGLPSRHAVLTWASISLGMALVARAIALSSRRVIAHAISITLVVVIAGASSFTLPRNLVSTQAYANTPENRAISAIHWELAVGDTLENGDERRCQTFERAETFINNYWVTQRLEPAADEVFRRIYGLPYCSTWSPVKNDD